jgi:hypothetical protein
MASRKDISANLQPGILGFDLLELVGLVYHEAAIYLAPAASGLFAGFGDSLAVGCLYVNPRSMLTICPALKRLPVSAISCAPSSSD